MFGPGGVPAPYRPHSPETRLKMRSAQLAVRASKRAARARLLSLDALFSEDGSKRYWLSRVWDIESSRGVLGIVMLNPSLACAKRNDPTIRKCIGFAKRWGFGGIIVTNLIPVIATNPYSLPAWRGLYSANEPYLRAALSACDVTAVAWGSPARALRRTIAFSEHVHRFREIAGKRTLYCIGLTRHGDPLHPSRAAYTDEIEQCAW